MGGVSIKVIPYTISQKGIVARQAYGREYDIETIIPMPTNAYGVGDNFDPNASHVIPALVKRFHEAKISDQSEVILWGTGTPLREFIYVDDLADALIFLMQNHNSPEIINVGTMQEITIADLANEIARVVGFTGRITLDTTKPDGAPRKCLDSSAMFNKSWKPMVSLKDGLAKMYHYFVTQIQT